MTPYIHRENQKHGAVWREALCTLLICEENVKLSHSWLPCETPRKICKEIDEVTKQFLVKRDLGIAITEGLNIRSEIFLFKSIQESIILFCRDSGEITI